MRNEGLRLGLKILLLRRQEKSRTQIGCPEWCATVPAVCRKARDNRRDSCRVQPSVAACPRRGALIAPSRCGRSASHRAAAVAIAESVRSPMIFSHCHAHGWQRRGATAARGRYHTAPPCACRDSAELRFGLGTNHAQRQWHANARACGRGCGIGSPRRCDPARWLPRRRGRRWCGRL